MALQLLFARLQSRPWEGMPALRRVSQHADLDHIVEADVWPWLERESAAAQAISRPEGEGGSAAGGDSTELLSHEARALLRKAAEGTGVLHYREQIEPLAKFAYRLHELGTQAAYLATRELGGSTGTRQTLLSDDDARILTTYATILMQHSTWVRSCAVQARYAAITSDQVRRIGRTASDDDGNHQWWADLTTRPITSDVRDAVARAMTHGEIASLLRNLADESDALHTEIGDAFERVGWNRNIAAGTSCVGPGFRTVSERLSATDREGSEPGSGEGEGPGARDG
ncbi:MAG: hypothetical protein JST91_03270 [Actinobacteria bacterium]|nr:hypothetical protein [Actinomycetota bacterium]